MATDTLTLNSGSGGSDLSVNNLADGTKCQNVKILSAADASESEVHTGNGTNGNALRVTLASDSSGQVKLAAGSATVGEVTIGAATTAAGDLAKAEDAAHATGDVGIMALAVRTATPADKSGADGDYEPLQLDNGKLWCQVGGSVAHDSAAGSNDNPVLLGGVAYETDGTAPGTAVAEGDISRLKTTLDGQLMVSGAHPNAFTATATGSTAATTVLKTAPGAGLHIYITDVIFGAGGIQQLKLTEDTAGTPVDKVELVYLAANDSWSHSFATPLRLTENVNLGVISAQAQAYSCTVSGFVAP